MSALTVVAFRCASAGTGTFLQAVETSFGIHENRFSLLNISDFRTLIGIMVFHTKEAFGFSFPVVFRNEGFRCRIWLRCIAFWALFILSL